MKLLTTILVTLLLFSTSTYTAKVVRVSDGDTITVLTENKDQIRIRLEGMDKVEMLDDKKKPDLYNKVYISERGWCVVSLFMFYWTGKFSEICFCTYNLSFDVTKFRI